jgi:gliding motility-associated-like protein
MNVIFTKNRLLMICFCLFVGNTIQAQVLDWGFPIGNSGGYDQGENMVYHDGHIYVIGKFSDSLVDFNPSLTSSSLLTSGNGNGNLDVFVAKYDTTGQFVWAFNIGDTLDDIGRDIAIFDNEIYIIGDFEGNNVDFDPSGGTALLSSNGSADIFVAKYDTSGQYINAFNIGGSENEMGKAIEVDSNGIYITGFFDSNNVNFAPLGGVPSVMSNSGNSYDIYLASYTHNLANRWSFQIGKGDTDRGKDLAVYEGSVYLTGYFEGTNVDFDPSFQNNSLSSKSSAPDIFVARYAANTGNYEWAFSIGNAINPFCLAGYCMGLERSERIVVKNDKVYIGGVFSKTVDFDPSPNSSFFLNAGVWRFLVGSIYLDDCFVAQYDLDANFEWAWGFGDPQLADELYGMAVNDSGDVVVSGIFADVIQDLDPNPNNTETLVTNQNNGWDIYAVKYSSTGDYVWSFNAGGSSTNASKADNAKGIAFDANQNMYMTGRFYSPNANFAAYPPQQLLQSGSNADVFVTKYLDYIPQLTCPVNDYLELVNFYYATGEKLNWDLDDPYLTWDGIYDTDGNGCVDSIRIVNEDLEGSLPNLKLSELTYLNLSSNDIGGNIPLFEDAPLLETLILSSNNFINNIPNFEALPFLKTLDLTENALTDTIPHFDHLTQLEYLQLGDNNLIDSLPLFTNNTQLKNLDISDNKMDGTVPDFNLPNLESLRLGNNLLDSLPDFANLPKLRHFNIGENELFTTPNFTNLPRLENLYLDNNHLSGILTDFSHLPNLKRLNLSANDFDSSMAFVGIDSLGVLIVSSNELTFDDLLPHKNIPSNILSPFSFPFFYTYDMQDSVGRDTSIQVGEGQAFRIQLDFDDTVSSNQYDWYRDSIFVATTQTNYLDISWATLQDSGAYTCQVTNSDLPNLRLYTRPIWLEVRRDCPFIDSLALVDFYQKTDSSNWNTIWNLQTPYTSWYGITADTAGCVTQLQLDSNQLAGKLPNIRLANLELLSLKNNQLDSIIPNFDYISNIQYLDLSDNQFNEKMPELDKVPNLRYLDFSNNKLSDSVISFSAQESLYYINLAENQLIGIIHDISRFPLVTFNINNNEIDSLSNLGNITTFGTGTDEGLMIDNNQLTFDDILPNVPILNTINFVYAPQDSAGILDTLTLLEAETDSIQLSFDESISGVYEWYKESQYYATTFTNKLPFSNITLNDSGFYYCKITNPAAPDLVLRSRPIYVQICPKPRLGNDFSICFGSDTILRANIMANQFSWSNSSSNSDSLLINSTDNFMVTATNNALGCTHSDTIAVTVEPEIIWTDSIRHISCFGADDGFLSVAVSGGIAPYQYFWYQNNNLISSDSFMNNLSAGNYDLVIMDALGCEKQMIYIITEGNVVINSNPTIKNVSCFGGNDGNITLAPTGGTPNYTYNWSTTPNNLFIGTYSVTITDNLGCILQDSFEILEPTLLTAQVIATSKTCLNANKGEAIVTATGGTLPYLYQWSSSTEMVNNPVQLAGGTNTTTVTDANGCIEIQQIEIDTVLGFVATGSVDALPCVNDSGVVSILVNNGDLPYSYEWNTGDTTFTVNNLSAGLYLVTVTERNNCEFEATALIIAPPSISIQSTINQPILCHGDSTGQATVTSSGGSGNHQYLWDNGGITPFNAYLKAGINEVAVQDDSGCVYLDTVILTTPPAIQVIDSLIQVDSCGQGNGASFLAISGGVAPYLTQWQNNIITQNDTAVQLGGGYYTVIITDNNNCELPYTTFIPSACDTCLTFSPFQMLDFGSYNCLGQGISDVNIQVTGGSPASMSGYYIYEITGTNTGWDGIETNTDGQLIFQVADSSHWQVTISDSESCDSILIDDVFYENIANCANFCDIYPPQIYLTEDTLIEKGSTIPLWLNGGSDILWQTNDHSLQCLDCSFQYITPMSSSTYRVEVTGENGCVIMEEIQIDVCDECSCNLVEKPTLLTPNGDGVNDLLTFNLIGLCPNNRLEIFDRWGRKAFPTLQNYNNDWDGGDLQAGVYFYILTGGKYLPQDIQGYFQLVKE